MCLRASCLARRNTASQQEFGSRILVANLHSLVGGKRVGFGKVLLHGRGAGGGIRSDYRCSERPPTKWPGHSAVIAALVLRTALSGWSGVKSGFIGVGIAGGLFCVFYIMGAMGGGDMKMMAAVGAWVGRTHVLTVLVSIALAGGVLALVSVIVNKNLIQTVRNAARLVLYRFTAGLEPHPEMNVQAPGSRRIPFWCRNCDGNSVCAANAAWWR